MRTIIIILSVCVFSLQAADLPAFWLEDEWATNSVFETVHPMQFVSKITRDKLAKTPAWEQDREFPPVSPRKAEDIALAMLHKVMGERHWSQPEVLLKAFDVSSSHRNIRWFYVLHFEFAGPADYEGGRFNIIVLMDGTAIEPKPVK